jgi:hypothetical protein
VEVAKKFPNVHWEISVSRTAACFYATGLILDFKDTPHRFSLQTDPSITGNSLCESALLSKTPVKLPINKITKKRMAVNFSGDFGYGNVIRWIDEESFRDHIEFVFNEIDAQCKNKCVET